MTARVSHDRFQGTPAKTRMAGLAVVMGGLIGCLVLMLVIGAEIAKTVA